MLILTKCPAHKTKPRGGRGGRGNHNHTLHSHKTTEQAAWQAFVATVAATWKGLSAAIQAEWAKATSLAASVNNNGNEYTFTAFALFMQSALYAYYLDTYHFKTNAVPSKPPWQFTTGPEIATDPTNGNYWSLLTTAGVQGGWSIYPIHAQFRTYARENRWGQPHTCRNFFTWYTTRPRGIIGQYFFGSLPSWKRSESAFLCVRSIFVPNTAGPYWSPSIPGPWTLISIPDSYNKMPF